MSNIYNLEPPTNGKVILKTTVGDIEIELWSKECPKTCRNFIQLCMEGYYDRTIFHRVVKDFIVQGGDPTGTGEGGESCYEEPFKDEFHSRLRFNRRGLLGMANSQKDDNASQFFFTLGNCPELNNKHTLFAKTGGATVFNMIKLNESELIDERPVRPEKIISTEIIYNPFDDIKPRNLRAKRQNVVEKKPEKKGVKNFGLLSFGDEAEEDEEELDDPTFRKAKSAHDVGDPTLLSKKLDEKNVKYSNSSNNSSDSDSGNEGNNQAASKKSVDLNEIKAKLKKKEDELKRSAQKITNDEIRNVEKDEKAIKKKQTKEEIKKIQKELLNKDKVESDLKKVVEEKKEEKLIVKEYKEDVEKYDHLRKGKVDQSKKSKKNKEDKTLELMNSFRAKLFQAKKNEEETENTESNEDKNENKEEQTEKDEENSLEKNPNSLWTHRLEVDDDIKQKVVDANVADNDRWAIYDPRNPMNKRKLEESKKILNEKRKQGEGRRFDR